MERGECGVHLEDVFVGTTCAQEQEQENVIIHLHPVGERFVLERKYILSIAILMTAVGIHISFRALMSYSCKYNYYYRPYDL